MDRQKRMIPQGLVTCDLWGMRTGVEIWLGPEDRERLEAVIASGNSPQRHVWRGRWTAACCPLSQITPTISS